MELQCAGLPVDVTIREINVSPCKIPTNMRVKPSSALQTRPKVYPIWVKMVIIAPEHKQY